MVDQQEIIDRLTRRNQELESELEEFQQSSRELERELEAQLEQSEKRNSDLTAANGRLALEVESLKVKLSEVTVSTSDHIAALESDLRVTKETNDQLVLEIRDLEQSNDDLERAQRALAASLEEFESKFNEQIEKNVFLESELGEKSDLEIMIQRLKDEVRDLKQELQIQEQRSAEIVNSHHHRYPRRTGSINSPVVTVGPTTTSVTSTVTTTTATTPCGINNNSVLSKPVTLKKTMIPVPAVSPVSAGNGKIPVPAASTCVSAGNGKIPVSATSTCVSAGNGKIPVPALVSPVSTGVVSPVSTSVVSPVSSGLGKEMISPRTLSFNSSTRSSALNIVSDLLRKVGALESKLAACRNLVPPGTPVRNRQSLSSPTSTSLPPLQPSSLPLQPSSLPLQSLSLQSTSNNIHH